MSVERDDAARVHATRAESMRRLAYELDEIAHLTPDDEERRQLKARARRLRAQSAHERHLAGGRDSDAE